LHTFQTTPATIEVKDCSGNAVQGTEITYFISNSGGGNVGTTGPSGVVSTELFPGTYQFRARINKTTGYADVDITAGTPIDHTFVPTVVEFHHTLGKVSMWQNNIGGTTLNGPTYIFPGTYTIEFYEGNTKLYSMPLTVAEGVCGIEKSLLILDLLDSNGGGLPDGDFVYRFGYGSYTSIGTTDASGRIFYSLDGPPANTKVKVTYNGASLEKQQNVATNSHFVFQTVPVTAVLNNSGSSPITSGVSFKYRYSFDPYQTFTSPMELLPVNTKVRVYYAGSSLELQQNVATNPNFVFNTVSVTATLNDHLGSPISNGVSFKYRYSFDPYQTFTNPMELLPVNTKVRVFYAGSSFELQQNVATNPNFVFQTGSVSSSTCSRYRYSYDPYQTFTSPMELLAVSTKFSDADGPDISVTPISGATIPVDCQ
jgi:hypothetical protein